MEILSPEQLIDQMARLAMEVEGKETPFPPELAAPPASLSASPEVLELVQRLVAGERVQLAEDDAWRAVAVLSATIAAVALAGATGIGPGFHFASALLLHCENDVGRARHVLDETAVHVRVGCAMREGHAVPAPIEFPAQRTAEDDQDVEDCHHALTMAGVAAGSLLERVEDIIGEREAEREAHEKLRGALLQSPVAGIHVLLAHQPARPAIEALLSADQAEEATRTRSILHASLGGPPTGADLRRLMDWHRGYISELARLAGEADRAAQSSPAALAAQLREMLSLCFGVDQRLISVRATARPVDPALPEGPQVLRLEVELDGKDPPAEWGAFIENLVLAISPVIKGIDIKMSSGVGERHADGPEASP